MRHDKDKISLAVIEGMHPFDVRGWHKMLRSLEGVCYDPQTMDNWAYDFAGGRFDYDVLLFYNMHMTVQQSPYPERVYDAISNLGQCGKGLIFLHHALAAYPENDTWSKATGLARRDLDYFADQRLRVEIADGSHPITEGLEPFEIEDETYKMPEPDESSHILLTASHPKSMRALGWTRSLNDSRVFCFQCGHDRRAYENAGFVTVLTRAIRWAVNRF